MKFYYSDISAEPMNINLDDLLNRYRNYDFHFYTQYLSDEGIFVYEKNILYCEKINDNKIETKQIGDYEIIVDYSEIKHEPWFHLPNNHIKEIIYKYSFPFKNFQFAIECVRAGNKCVLIDTYFEIRDIKMLNIQETCDSLNEFLLTLK